MAHQPFEKWLFEVDDLTGAQKQALEGHLAECPDCCKLQQSWQDLHQQIRASVAIGPAEGFGERWRASLTRKRAARQRRRQSLSLLAFLTGGAFLNLIILGGFMLATISQVDLFDLAIQWMVGLATFTEEALVLLATIPPAVSIILWVVLTTGLVGLAVLWVGSLWKVSVKGERQK